MISISVQDEKIYCTFITKSEEFTNILTILKENNCHYLPSLKKWEIPYLRYDKIIDLLQDIEVLQISEADQRLIPQLFSKTELKLSSSRLIFQPKLLRYPPFKGKPPYENFQLQDILRAINRNRYGLFLDMGLGKAYIAAAIICHLRYYNLANKALLISSNIGAANMEYEIRKFIVDLDPSEIICMPKISHIKTHDRSIFTPKAKIVITNYNTFRHLSDHYAKQAGVKTKGYRKPPIPFKEWLEDKPGILLLDESHALGNPASLQTKKIMMHIPFFEYRYEFTGTPSDKPEKLYSQLKILDNTLIYSLSYQDWCAEYNETGNGFSKYAINPDRWKYDKLQQLNTRITKDYGIFRKSEDCLDLPPNLIKRLYLHLEGSHRKIYQFFVRQTLEEIKEDTGGLRTRDVLNAFPYMQMSLDNPSLLLNHSRVLSSSLNKLVTNFNFEKDNAKVEMLLDILMEKVEEKNEKGIVWIYHPDTAHKLLSILKKYNPLYVIGETPDKDRLDIVDTFKKNDDHKILIAGIPVLNTSITVTEATFQVYFERIYNFAQYWQSMARIHRIGQKQTTTTYVLIFDESIDVTLDLNLSNKDIINSKLLSKDFLSLEEWKNIFNATSIEGDLFGEGN